MVWCVIIALLVLALPIAGGVVYVIIGLMNIVELAQYKKRGY